MTAQIPETLLLDGQAVAMMTNPLNEYLALGGPCPEFRSGCTALWRGYVGTWELRDERLYLIELTGTLSTGEPASLESVFPGFGQRVFAHWFSGTVRLPQGKRIQYMHMGYGSRFERDEWLSFQDGVLVDRRVVYNGVAPSGAVASYGPSAMTVFPARRDNPGETP